MVQYEAYGLAAFAGIQARSMNQARHRPDASRKRSSLEDEDHRCCVCSIQRGAEGEIELGRTRAEGLLHSVQVANV